MAHALGFEPRHILKEARRKTSELARLLEQFEAHGGTVHRSRTATDLPVSSLLDFLVNVNGRRQRVSEREIHSIRPGRYDLFLDVTRGLLWTRPKGRRGRLLRIEETVLHSEDVNTLAFMMEHPGRYFSHENLPNYLPGPAYLERNTFQKRISRIRRTLRDDGTFIVRVTDAHYKVSSTGNAYYFNGERVSYCLVQFADPAEKSPH